MANNDVVTFKVPQSIKKSILTIDTFLGCDFTNSPAAVSELRSPNCINLIRDVPGKIRKCMGYEVIEDYTDDNFEAVCHGSINGFHTLHGKKPILHVGTNIVKDGEVIYSDANDHRSQSWQFEDKIIICDGKKLLSYDGETVATVESKSYIPTLTISRDPNGGGKDYEALNLLQPGFKELFTGTAEDTKYQLSFGNLDDTPVKVEVLNGEGEWVTKTLTTDYTVDRVAGIITFVTAPGETPLKGEDNVKITAYRTVDGYADRINKCTIGIQYGVNGALDRLFLSGNSDFINYDWYSGQNDPTYFPDTGYAKLGSGRSAVVGYSIINSYLATHKDENEEHQTIILRNGSLVDNEASFRIINTLQGAGAIAPYSFSYLSNEPLFLTRLGIYAVTAQDVTGEKYAQNRSFYLNGKMLQEPNLEDAFAVVYNDMYWLCINDKLYILDGLQPQATDKSLPYSNRQYVGFYRTNVPANTMWVQDGRFFFGTRSGKVCRFFIDEEAPASYNDDGEAIEAIWETPDLDGKLFYKNKTFKYMAVKLKSAVATSLKIFAMKHGIWSFLKEDSTSARYFAFSRIIFSKYTYSTDTTQKIISTKLRIKKVDSARFRLVNDELNEPLGIYNIALEYVENGNFKG